MPKIKELKASLMQKERELEGRLHNINKEKQRRDGPLEADSSEQAISLQNNEVVDGLDELERGELVQIKQALERMTLGTFGVCTECGEKIAEKRLLALPFARNCVNCLP